MTEDRQRSLDRARTALACLDLTSQNDSDDAATIKALVARAAEPAGPPAALCVWLDWVLPWRALRGGDAAAATAVVVAVRQACPAQTLKLIIESGELATPALIRQACALVGSGKTASGARPQAARQRACDAVDARVGCSSTLRRRNR